MSLWCHWQFSRNEEIAFLGEAWQIKWSGVSFYPQSAVTFSEWLKWTAAATSWISNDLRGQIIIIQEDNEKPNKSPQRRILSSAVRFLCMTGEKNNRVLLQSHECNIQVQAAGRNFYFFFLFILAAPVDRSGMIATYIRSHRSWPGWLVHSFWKHGERKMQCIFNGYYYVRPWGIKSICGYVRLITEIWRQGNTSQMTTILC